MGRVSRILGALAAVAFLPSALAQNNAPNTITDSESGIVFNTWGVPQDSAQSKGGWTFGVALPSNALSTDATEFIGYLVSLFVPTPPNALGQILTSTASNVPPKMSRAGVVSPSRVP